MQRDDANAEEIREKAGDLQKRSLSLFEIAYKKVSFFVSLIFMVFDRVIIIIILDVCRKGQLRKFGRREEIRIN